MRTPTEHVPAIDKPPRKYIWIPLSFRMFVAILLVVGVGSALWVGIRSYHQRVAIQEIESVHGFFTTREIGPSWLRRCVGPEGMKTFDEIIFVNLAHTKNTSAGAAHLDWLPNVEYVDLWRSTIMDADLVHIAKLSRLDSLHLMETRVGDAGIENLRPVLPQLAVLYLNDTAVTDNGLAFLSDLVRIEHLSLAGTRITDAGLSHLAELTKLQELNLAETRVSDVGLKHLHSMSQLQHVCLNETNVTDAGVAELGHTLPNLHIERRADQD